MPTKLRQGLRNKGMGRRRKFCEERTMKLETEISTEPVLLRDRQMGWLGVELIMKATACAALIALVAGMVAVLFGS